MSRPPLEKCIVKAGDRHFGPFSNPYLENELSGEKLKKGNEAGNLVFSMQFYGSLNDFLFG